MRPVSSRRWAALLGMAVILALTLGVTLYSQQAGTPATAAPTQPVQAPAAQGGVSRTVSATPPYVVDPPQPPYATRPQPLPNYRVIIRHNVQVPMRDGTMLRADVYWPDTPGNFPVLVERTPYNKDVEDIDVGLRGAQRGYIMVLQDVRGRYASAGEWYPFKHEIEDGYDTVEWAAKLPNSDGKVGMYGGSYVGATQYLAALANPPSLAGIFPMCTPSSYYKDWAYQNGALQQFFAESWATQLNADELDHQIQRETNPMASVATLPLGNYTSLESPPIAGHDGLAALSPWYLDWLQHPTDDAYWEQWAIDKDYSRIRVPVFMVGGWYDLFLEGTLANYDGIKADGGTAAARNGVRLLIMPGGHAGWQGRVGAVNFAPAGYVDYYGVMFDWYDALLRGVDNGMLSEKPVQYFVMGKDTWRSADTWPPPEPKATAYYLHSEGKANTSAGDGSLSTTSPAANEPPDRFIYNPADPVPTLGGKLCCLFQHLRPGVADQRPDEARPDVLVYSTPPLAQNLDVTGPVTLTLYVSSSAPDTDFVATLTDVAPDGTSYNVADGIVRMRYRNSLKQASFLTPGEIYKINIDLWATSNVFLAGHRLRVDISSSNFPHFDRNLNTQESPETGASFVTATNTIYHDAAHPLVLMLPVMSQ